MPTSRWWWKRRSSYPPPRHGCVQNGIALSATAHSLFDRHLISLDDECRLLVSHNMVPAELIRLFPAPGERVHLPADTRLRSNRDYVALHRACFAGLDI